MIGKIRNTGINADKALRLAVSKSAQEVKNQMIANTPVDTGNLKSSIKITETFAKPIYIADIGPDKSIAPYYIYVERGHEQTPGRYVPAIGKRLVAKWVNGKWYIARTAIQIGQKVEDNINTAFKRIF